MDKLKALQYFLASAEDGSFSAAARRHGVSVPAVTKLVTALEKELGVRLLDRSRQGLALTPQGDAYRSACQPLVAQLEDADRAVAGVGAHRERTLVVGAPSLLSRVLLVPALAGFHQRHRHVQIDLRTVDHLTVTPAQAKGLDVVIALGWPGTLDLVKRPLAQSRLIVCASPAYWLGHGQPESPADLARHTCPLVRSPEGTVLDLWRHAHGDRIEEVAVSGWLICESRDDVLQAVLHGQGVGRFADISVWPLVRDGRLQPVLTEWESRDSPPFSALIRQEARRDPLVQEFVEFLAELLGGLEAECRAAIGPRPQVAQPGWYLVQQGRASRKRGSR